MQAPSKATIALEQAKADYTQAVYDNGGTIKDGVVGGLDREAKNKVKNEMAGRFSNTATDTVKSSKKIDWSKLVGGLQSTAAMFNTQNTPQTSGTTEKKTVAQWDLDSMSRFQKIKNSRLSATYRG